MKEKKQSSAPFLCVLPAVKGTFDEIMEVIERLEPGEYTELRDMPETKEKIIGYDYVVRIPEFDCYLKDGMFMEYDETEESYYADWDLTAMTYDDDFSDFDYEQDAMAIAFHNWMAYQGIILSINRIEELKAELYLSSKERIEEAVAVLKQVRKENKESDEE